MAKFFDWAERAREPLRSYATGLLALAMEQVTSEQGHYRVISVLWDYILLTSFECSAVCPI